MKRSLPSFLLAIIILSFFSVLFLPSLAGAQVTTPEPGWKGIVPCGRNTGTAEEQAPCTLCHLVVGFQRLVQYGMYMVVTLALVGIFCAGVMYIVSTGDENMMTQAKGFLKVSLIGFAVVISGWLIVNVTMWVLGAKTDLGVNAVAWNKFTCDTKSSQGTGGSATSTTTPGTTATPPVSPAPVPGSIANPGSVDPGQNPSPAPTPAPTPTPIPTPTPETPPSTAPDSGNVDLLITSFKSPSAGGNNLTSAVTVIKNAGSDPVGSFTVKLYMGNTAIDSQTISGLAAGASIPVTLHFIARTVGSVHTYYKIYVIIDPDNAVEETNENNNNSGERDFEVM